MTPPCPPPCPPRRYDLLLFDFDGTLADSSLLFDQFVPALARQRGVAEPLGGWQALRAMDTRGMLRVLKIRWWQLPGVTRQMRAAMAANLDQVSLYPGMADVLAHLHGQGVQLVVVSSNTRATVAQVLGPALPWFSALHCGAPLLGKRRVIARALRQAGVPAARALSIGDEARDGQASQACGMDFVGVGWGLANTAVLQPYSAFSVLAEPAGLMHCVFPGRARA